ncbi:hypothetical protein MMAGJ_73980 [Mycolicibacterium mageritense]|uniref:Uncharacterized protein n=2 Tax=Mycobacteriaceae TaxID=1762 RepID=A0AAI8U228_MYCME|nr:hypothetical protein EB73_01305 [Mycobacterium sp. SWH-M3]BBX38116.1 hypothetical protein MMAGJ_73980 [Mycolicibacterium mageritense]BDY32752.1 hypothetical protein hbim_06722 [Mycolicibacterium mageritense]GJJ16414.1 hypothetical protein MTY414_00870 [Mycolicibacterium mageritense]CDO27149.1 hypothetical protein BN978_07714 [Mycolicibacterium mageritense DSM 44476 = CIP 104973]
MDPALELRIQNMFKRDVLVATVLAGLMWATLIFVFFAAFSVIENATVKAMLGIACVILGVFNSLGLLSMARRYKIEREHVYGEDIHHLDVNRKARQVRREVAEVTAA